MFVIQNDILWQPTQTANWKNVKFFPTPNKGTRYRPDGIVIDILGGSLCAFGTAQYFQKTGTRSGHINIDTQGNVSQNIEFTLQAQNADNIVINLCNTEVTQPQVDILEHIVDILVEKYKIGRPEKIQPTQ